MDSGNRHAYVGQVLRRIGVPALSAGMLLLCGGVAMAAYVPHGTYAETCRNIHVEGPYLRAVCTRLDGGWNVTQIFVPHCGRSNISNQNGHLTCGE
jgi:hypothetical protein